MLELQYNAHRLDLLPDKNRVYNSTHFIHNCSSRSHNSVTQGEHFIIVLFNTLMCSDKVNMNNKNLFEALSKPSLCVPTSIANHIFFHHVITDQKYT